MAGWDGSPVWLAIDRTDWAFGKTRHNLLVISALLGDTAIPLVWKSLGKNGGSSTEDRIALMKRLLLVLPAARVAGVMGDREFMGECWMAWLCERRIPFIIRLRDNTRVALDSGEVFRVSTLCAKLREGKAAKAFPAILTQGLRVNIQGKRTCKGLVIVAFSGAMPTPQPVNFYRRRWRIECAFACLKRKGFELEDTHLTHPSRLETLLGAVVIAFAWALRIGLRQRKPTRKNHGYPITSRFTLGKHILIYALQRQRKLTKLIRLAFNPADLNRTVV